MKWTEVYMNIKKFISSIGIKLIYSTSGAIYVASYVAFIFLYLTIKHQFINSLFLMGVVLVFLIRIIIRELMLNRLDYVEIDGYKLKNMKENAFQRSYQFLDFVYMMIIIFLIFALENKKFLLIDDLLWVVYFYIGIYFTAAHISIKYDKIIFKAIAIICSTFQGVMTVILLIFIGIPLGFIIIKDTYFSNLNQAIANVTKIFSGSDDNLVESFLALGYALEKIPLLTIIPVVISVVLFAIYIFMTPYDQLNKLSDAFKIVNIATVLLGIVVFFLSEKINSDIFIYLNDNRNVKSIEEMINVMPDEFKQYIINYSQGNIKNFINIAILPYTFSALIANFILEKIKSNNVKKANLILNDLMENKQIYSEYQLIEFRKKYLYYGGDSIQLRLVEKYNSDDENVT